MYDFNLLVSCPWSMVSRARREIVNFLRLLGDEEPTVSRTLARGIVGVKTNLDAREVVQGLTVLFRGDPSRFQYTFKWVPVDLWTDSNIDSLKAAVEKVRDKIGKGERWRITLEKRRYTLHHRIDIIRALAELIDERVDLTNPDKILRIDIIGRFAGVSVLSPDEVFSATRLAVKIRVSV
jgi:tRNA acetyltransferase TAN1